jgi:hypothetical protein
MHAQGLNMSRRRRLAFLAWVLVVATPALAMLVLFVVGGPYQPPVAALRGWLSGAGAVHTQTGTHHVGALRRE